MKKESAFNFLSLFASANTLICCAIPALLVAIGAGATLASAVSSFPSLIWLSEHKVFIFGFGFFMLVLAGFIQWKSRNQPCPLDLQLAQACTKTRKFSTRIYFLSVILYLIGVLIAFGIPKLMELAS